jgi:hypothetical protein
LGSIVAARPSVGRLLALLVALALVVVLAPLPPAGAEDDPMANPYRAGAAVRSVTPTAEHLAGNDLYLGGFGALTSRGHATGVHDDIHARAFAFGGETRADQVVVISLDLPASATARCVRSARGSPGRRPSPRTR